MTLANKIYATDAAVITEPLDTGLALTHIGCRKIFVLNITGSSIWQLLDGNKTCYQIASDIALLFSIPIEQAEREVYVFVERLASAGLILEQKE